MGVSDKVKSKNDAKAILAHILEELVRNLIFLMSFIIIYFLNRLISKNSIKLEKNNYFYYYF